MVKTIISRTVDLTKPTELDTLEGRLYTIDDDADQFRIKPIRNGAAVDLTGASVQGYFQRSDGVTLKINGSVDGEEAVLTLDDRCYTVPGRFILAIKVTQGAVRHTIYACAGGVAQSQTDTVYVPDGALEPDLAELLARMSSPKS